MLDCKVINKFHDGHILPLILLQKISLLPLGRIKKIRIFTKHKNKKKERNYYGTDCKSYL